MNKRYKSLIGGGLLVAASFALFSWKSADAGQPFTFSSIDYPVSALPPGVTGVVSTAVWDVNNLGDMVGTYGDTNGLFHGFVYRNGKFSTVDGPTGAGGDIAVFTQIRSINDLGDIAGMYIPYSAILHPIPGGGFRALYQKHGGQLTVYTTAGHLNTIFNKITDTGLVYGCFHDDGVDTGPQDSMFGIVGQISQWPNVQVISDSVAAQGTPGSTMNVGGNPSGTQFTGVFYDHNDGSIKGVPGRHRAYIIKQSGDADHDDNGHVHMQRTNFDVPGSNNTSSWDMNVEGDVVGIWGHQQNTDSGFYHGFLRSPDGKFLDIEYPNSQDTEPQGINDLGTIVGSYVDAAGKVHGFVAKNWFFGANRSRGIAGMRSVALLLPSLWPASLSQPEGFSSARVGIAKVIPNDRPLQPPAMDGMACCHRHSKMAMSHPK